MATLEAAQIRAWLAQAGQRSGEPATLYLLGGSALCLLGSTRPTQDVAYVGDDLHKNSLQQIIEQVAGELHILVEAVPIEQFVPIPPDAQERRILWGASDH